MAKHSGVRSPHLLLVFIIGGYIYPRKILYVLYTNKTIQPCKES